MSSAKAPSNQPPDSRVFVFQAAFEEALDVAVRALAGERASGQPAEVVLTRALQVLGEDLDVAAKALEGQGAVHGTIGSLSARAYALAEFVERFVRADFVSFDGDSAE